MKFVYDKQLRKYIQQFMRLFSDFSVEIGTAYDGTPIYKTIPVNYGDISRMAAHILKNNSENVVQAVPFMSVYINSMRMAPTRRTFQQHTLTAQVSEKKYDNVTGQYINEPGTAYDITRHNPVPYDITFNLDIWTSNTDQKFQIMEQIGTIFNPHINLRTNNNPVDWSGITYVEMTDITWSGRSIPSGVDDVIDVATFQFTVPIYINPPVQVKRQNSINTIINKLHLMDGENLQLFESNKPFTSQFVGYTIVTLENYKLNFQGDHAIITTTGGQSVDSNGDPLNWSTILPKFGLLRSGISQLRLRRTLDPGDDSEDIIGTITLSNTDPDTILVTVDPDTLPALTLGTVNRIVNGSINFPNDGILPPAALNQKYLLVGETSENGVWGLTAKPNDIITYNGVSWVISYDSDSSDSEIVYDSNTAEQYEWNGNVWQKSYIGLYNAGYWRIYL